MELFLFVSLVGLVYIIYGVIYRLYLSPIAHIPGPKIAALTGLYETYYDLYLGGQYTFKIIELHKEYGPIIRISPWELHVSDPDFFDTLYASPATGRRRDKYDWFTKSFGLDKSIFGTTQHDLHKIRRGALGQYFSMASVRKLQPEIQERVDVLLGRLKEFRNTGEVLSASNAFAAYTNDIVMMYCFGRCDERLEAKDFDPSYRDASFTGVTQGNFLKHAPWVNNLLQALPTSVVELMHPAMATFVAQRRHVLEQIKSIRAGRNEAYKDHDHPTIFVSILDSKLPEQEKQDVRLSDDAHVLTMAGTITTSWVLEVTMFWLLSQPETLRKLKDELKEAFPNLNMVGTIPLPVLEKLPYLNAVMKEGFRLTYGVSCRLARIDPDNPMIFKTGEKQYTIPAGTPVGMTTVQIHHDESIFPDSKKFSPERWLDGKNKAIDKYLVSFNAGSRQCLGINLAHVELRLAMGAIWRQWGSREVRGADDVGVFELFETGVRDVEMESDAFQPLVQPGSKGVRALVFS